MWDTVRQKPVASRLGVGSGLLISLYCCLVTANWIGFGILFSPIMCCFLIALRLLMDAMERLVRKCTVGARAAVEKKRRRRKREQAKLGGVVWRMCLLSAARVLVPILHACLEILEALHRGDVVLVELLVWICVRRCIQRTRYCLWMCTRTLRCLSQLLYLGLHLLCRYGLVYTMNSPHAAPMWLMYEAGQALCNACVISTFVEEMVRLHLCLATMLNLTSAGDVTDYGHTGFAIP